MKKVLLYLPFESNFYQGLFQQIKKGFETNGYEVIGGCKYLEPEELLQTIEAHDPSLVFEMNRIKSDIPNFPSNLPHICWLVDYWEKNHEEIDKGADFLYLFSEAWLVEHTNFQGRHIDILHPGTDTDDYYIDKTLSKTNDFIFLGHLPKPWNENELSRTITTCKEPILFQDIVEHVHTFMMTPKDYGDGTISTRRYLKEILNRQTIKTSHNRVLHYDTYARLAREGRRLGVLAMALKSPYSLSIYGNTNWLLREQFLPYYKGELTTIQEMNQAFNAHQFLLHDGNMPHFRIFDAMASGLLVFKPNVLDYGVQDEWSSLAFEETTEIVTFNLTDEKLKVPNNMPASNELKHHLREIICKRHTWAHRIEKILKDIENA